jgi:hypothetical protein
MPLLHRPDCSKIPIVKTSCSIKQKLLQNIKKVVKKELKSCKFCATFEET